MNRRNFFSKLLGATVLGVAAKVMLKPVGIYYSHTLGVLKPMTQWEQNKFLHERRTFLEKHEFAIGQVRGIRTLRRQMNCADAPEDDLWWYRTIMKGNCYLVAFPFD